MTRRVGCVENRVMVRLNEEWSAMLDAYKDEHRHPMNQACHKVGVPLIAASVPVAMTGIGIPLAAAMFTVGWTFQLVGHRYEKNKPAFVSKSDPRYLFVGLVWWAQKMGLPVSTASAAA